MSASCGDLGNRLPCLVIGTWLAAWTRREMLSMIAKMIRASSRRLVMGSPPPQPPPRPPPPVPAHSVL
eukprot:4613927-Prorocentrum_lima.AAC.1